MISRRELVIATGAALLAPYFCWATDDFPYLLDHVILGCKDLDEDT